MSVCQRAAIVLVLATFFSTAPRSLAQNLPKPQPPPEARNGQVSDQSKDSDGLSKNPRSPGKTAQSQLNSSDANSNGHKHAGDGEKSPDPDWWIIGLTAGLVLVGAGQVWVLVRQTGILNKGLTETRNATELTRQSLVLTQRPRIGIRTVILDQPSYGDRFISTSINELIFKPTVYVEGTLLMVNIGNSQAMILHSYCRVLNSGEPERIPRQFLEEAAGTGGTLLTENTRLAPGQRVRCTFTGSGPSEEQVKHAGSQQFPKLNLYVIGWVDYADELKIVRRTTFCRRYDRPTDRFLPITDPDFEQAD